MKIFKTFLFAGLILFSATGLPALGGAEDPSASSTAEVTQVPPDLSDNLDFEFFEKDATNNMIIGVSFPLLVGAAGFSIYCLGKIAWFEEQLTRARSLNQNPKEIEKSIFKWKRIFKYTTIFFGSGSLLLLSYLAYSAYNYQNFDAATRERIANRDSRLEYCQAIVPGWVDKFHKDDEFLKAYHEYRSCLNNYLTNRRKPVAPAEVESRFRALEERASELEKAVK